MLGLKIIIVILSISALGLIYLWQKQKVKVDKLKVYEDITKSVINTDPKTRKNIEKLCNEYLEHKVINSKIVDGRYLKQCNLILDNIKYINMIYAIEPLEIKEKEKSIIEKAIEEDKQKVNSEKSKKGDK